MTWSCVSGVYKLNHKKCKLMVKISKYAKAVVLRILCLYLGLYYRIVRSICAGVTVKNVKKRVL